MTTTKTTHVGERREANNEEEKQKQEWLHILSSNVHVTCARNCVCLHAHAIDSC